MSSRLHSITQHIQPTSATMFHSLGVIFIIGGGPRIGYAVANSFYHKGYKVAIASRNPNKAEIEKKGWFPIEMDLLNLDAIRNGFKQVRERIGEPNVVVYNAAALTFAPEDDPFSISEEQFQNDLTINVTAAYACLKETITTFKELNNTTQPTRGLPRVFIGTGNVVPFKPIPFAFTLGSGKAALVHLIQNGNLAYGSHGWRFYWASQILEDGSPVPYEQVDAEAHGKKYVELVEQKKLGEWDVRFV
jgi:NAD(P)-dependent dehydrogenase (short-subunit alcohol dehydrogenase family)